jgi:hypothetical protein
MDTAIAALLIRDVQNGVVDRYPDTSKPRRRRMC